MATSKTGHARAVRAKKRDITQRRNLTRTSLAQRRREVRDMCRAQREHVKQRAREAREALREAIALAKADARATCAAARGPLADQARELADLQARLAQITQTMRELAPRCPGGA